MEHNQQVDAQTQEANTLAHRKRSLLRSQRARQKEYIQGQRYAGVGQFERSEERSEVTSSS